MKQSKFTKANLILIAIVSLCPISGCVSKERVETYDLTTTGKDWVKTETIQERRGPHGKFKIEKQSVYEKVKCVGKKGNRIKASTPEECLKAGGKVIDESLVEEQTIQRN